jgi:hypothetical protein
MQNIPKQILIIFTPLLLLATSVSACNIPSLTKEPLVAKRITAPEAQALVWNMILHEKPGMNPEMQPSVKEVTSVEVWSHIGAQLFQTDDGNSETYLIKNRQVYRLGSMQWLDLGLDGLSGLTSIRVTDLDQNGDSELAYIHTIGSGIVSSEVAMFSEEWGEPFIREVRNVHYLSGGLMFDKIETDTLTVKATSFDWDKGTFEIIYPLGVVILEQQEGILQPVIKLRDDLPSWFEDLLFIP